MRHRPPPTDSPPAYPDDNAPVPPARRPTRWTVRRVRALAFMFVGLAVAASLVSVYLTYRAAESSAAQASAVDRRLSVLEDDLNERTRQRDAERDAAAEEQADFRANLCVVLGDLPADSPNLDRLREALGCPQPGVTEPAGRSPGRAAPSKPAGGQPGGSAAASSTSPTPATPPSSPPPSRPPPSGPPDRGPVADLACDLLPLC